MFKRPQNRMCLRILFETSCPFYTVCQCSAQCAITKMPFTPLPPSSPNHQLVITKGHNEQSLCRKKKPVGGGEGMVSGSRMSLFKVESLQLLFGKNI